MQIGKYDLDQIVKATIVDSIKIKLCFWGGLFAAVLYLAFQGIAIVIGGSSLIQMSLVAAGNVLAALVFFTAVIGVTILLKDSFGAKKKAVNVKNLLTQGIEKLSVFIGVTLLYIASILLLFLIEYALFSLGKAPMWGSLILGLFTIPLVATNFLALVFFILGLKLLPAVIVNEKGSPWALFKKLNFIIAAQPVQLLYAFAKVLVAVVPLAVLGAALLYVSTSATVLVQRIAFEGIILAGGYVQWPSIVFGIVTAFSYLAIFVLAAAYMTVFGLGLFYSIYLSAKTKA